MDKELWTNKQVANHFSKKAKDSLQAVGGGLLFTFVVMFVLWLLVSWYWLLILLIPAAFLYSFLHDARRDYKIANTFKKGTFNQEEQADVEGILNIYILNSE